MLERTVMEANRTPVTTGLFATALGLSATLLFWIQPLVAKSLLPMTGGAPAIWHTVIVFFQTTLLIGYFYAHVLTQHYPLKQQVIIHLALLTVAIFLLPLDRTDVLFVVNPNQPAGIPFQIWSGLFLSIGLPCLLISSTSPLLQSWYRFTNAKDATDPYFLYGASNIGSLSALLAFPLFAESFINLSTQFRIWSGSFILFGILVLLCQRCSHHSQKTTTRLPIASTESLAPRHPLHLWISFGFLGSSLMIGATTFLTTEVMNAPLIGILPLTIFLLTFIIAFGKRAFFAGNLSPTFTVGAILAVLFQMLSNATDPAWLIIVLHFGLVFFGCLALHSRLAKSRPAAQHVTRFYLWISMGGVGAGLAHTFVAPLLFDQVWEYPLTIVALALILGHETRPQANTRWRRVGVVSSLCAVSLFGAYAAARNIDALTPLNAFPKSILAFTLAATFIGSSRRTLFAGVIACLLILNAWRGDGHGKSLFIDRNFFGLSKVTLDPSGDNLRLVHGNTIHGRQSTDPDRQHLPLSYYHTAGPLRRIMKQYDAIESTSQVAVIGLGAGSMLFYGQPHQTWTIYEIDPLVIHLARDSGHFSYLKNPKVAALHLHLGDARIQIQNAAPQQFDLIVLDAFSSDSIPMHLFTREALALYLSKLADPGLLAFHISNRTLDLAPPLSRLADEFGLVSLEWEDPHEDPAQGKDPSHWVVLTRTKALFTKLEKDERWKPLTTPDGTPLWTDERSNVLDALAHDSPDPKVVP